MKKDLDVICLGGICQDLLLTGIPADALSAPDSACTAEEFIMALGGDAANEASVLARLGSRTAFLGRVGTDITGDFLVTALQKSGVDTSLIIRSQDCRNITSIVVIKPDRTHSFIVAMGENYLLREEDMDLTVFARTRALCIGSLFDLGDLECRSLDTLLPRIRGQQVLVFADMDHDLMHIGPRALDRVYPSLDYLIPSLEEGTYVTGETSPERIAYAFLSMGCGNVLVKLGAEGCYFQNARESFYLPSYDVTPVDTTGCGDNFAAGFVHAILRGESHRDAALFASAAGGLNALDMCASRMVRSEEQVRAFMSETPLRRG